MSGMRSAIRTGNEYALSEVIGFVLILGVIVVAFSLYLTYGIPAQGRGNEIAHMNDIRDEFTNYKIGVDSLWTNHQTSTVIGNTFSLGTPGQTTQGSNSIIPVLQPVGSSGTISINQRTPTPEIFSVTSTSYILNTSSMLSDPQLPIPSSTVVQTFQNPLSTLFINISASAVNQNDAITSNTRSVIVSGTSWGATINITPRIVISPVDYTNTTQTDLTITVTKNGQTTLAGTAVYSNIQANQNYTINLLDDAYGIRSSLTYPATVNYSNPSPTITAVAIDQYAYQKQANYVYAVPMGALEYSANNNYWIPQSYYYQMGGVFLSQSDGITYKLPPSITFAYGLDRNISVNIIALAYDGSSSGVLGGSSQVQVGTSLDSDSTDLPYAPVSPNTWNMNINITTTDPRAVEMWKDYLDEAANQTGGIPETCYTVGNLTSGAYISVNGINDPSGNPHLSLDVKTANLTAKLQSAGGQ